MKTNKNASRSWKTQAVAFTGMSLVLSPVYASDVEIYTRSVDSSTISPVVMMMLDTSGSMTNCLATSSSTNTNGTTCNVNDSPPTTRIGTLKAAINAILFGSSTTNPVPGYVKMGLSRYQDGSSTEGWVIYPARPLDALVAIAPNGTISNGMTASSSDTSGDVITGDLIISGTPAGLNFSNVLIPLGATVTKATLTLTAKATAVTPTQWMPYVQNIGDSPAFSATTPLSSSTRTWTPASSVVNIPAWVAGSTYAIDVTEQLQTAANNTAAGWCGGNAVSLKLLDVSGGSRTAYAYDSDPTKAATLVIQYKVDPDSSSSCIKQTMTTTFNLGLSADASTIGSTQAKLDDVTWPENSSTVTSNATNINLNGVSSSVRTRAAFRLGTLGMVPQGATINSASLVVTPSSSVSSGVSPTTIKMFKSENMNPICTATSTCTKPADAAANLTTASVSFTPSSITSGTAQTIDVKNLVQEVVSGASAANVYALGVLTYNTNTTNTNTSGTNVVVPTYSADNSSNASKAAYLTVNWTGVVTDLSRYTTVRDELWNAVAGLPASSNTPLGAAYAQAALYLLGKAPYKAYSSSKSPDSRTVASSGTPYISPINTSDFCSGNYIFLLTDGAPTVDGGVLTATQNATGHACTLPSGSTIAGGDIYNNWLCSFDLAKSLSSSSTNPLGVVVRTNAVFLGPDASANDSANMSTTTKLSGGQFTNAHSYQDLVNMLVATVNAAIDTNGIIASPGVSINQFNRLTSLDQVYFTLFDPTSITKRWNGNLKRYKLDTVNGIVDVNGAAAINADGSFVKTGQSYWSTSADGADSSSGGAAGVLPAPDSRNLFTYVDSSKTALDKIDTTSSTFVSNALSKMPSGITSSTMINLLNWYKGWDIADAYGSQVTNFTGITQRKKLGGGLHSKALLVNYGYTANTDPTNPANQNNIAFYSSLGATLHGFNSSTGVEVFGFTPGEKMPAIKTLYDNAISAEPEYGMDLSWSVLRNDANTDGQISSTTTGDKLYMYGGMRMGGNNYYALDLTSLTSPKMLFTILGGSGAYTNLGQTWSQPVITDIKVGSTLRKVIIFAGGYDPCWENETCGSTQLGNALYIVDAYTGELIWWASGTNVSATPAVNLVSAMTYSIPSAPKTLDLNGDGLTDTVYIGDLGGQLFRFDINNGQPASSLVTRVKLVAKLGSNGVTTPSSADSRRIYEAPTVALFKDATIGQVFAGIGVGTGNRSRPLNTLVTDRYAVLFDYDVSRPDLKSSTATGLQSTLQFSNLLPLDLTVSTSSGAPTYTTNATTGVTTPNSYGWYVNLSGLGEKSLSSGLIYLNHLFFNTYFPKTSTTTCNAVAGYSNAYEMCMPYGNMCDHITARYTQNVMIGLAGEPQFVVTKDPTITDPNKNLKLIKNSGTQFNQLPTTGSYQIIPRHRWMELNRNPAN